MFGGLNDIILFKNWTLFFFKDNLQPSPSHHHHPKFWRIWPTGRTLDEVKQRKGKSAIKAFVFFRCTANWGLCLAKWAARLLTSIPLFVYPCFCSYSISLFGFPCLCWHRVLCLFTLVFARHQFLCVFALFSCDHVYLKFSDSWKFSKI